MSGTVRVIEGFSREVNIPEGYEGAEIYNAPRPFPATVTWQGEFIRGVFYGAIDPVTNSPMITGNEPSALMLPA